MLNIRLKRIGKKKKPFYNIIVSDKKKYINGVYIEKLGFFDPIKKIKQIKIDRIKYWIDKGSLISSRVKSLLNK